MGVFKPFRSACAYSDVQSALQCQEKDKMLRMPPLAISGNPNPKHFVFRRVQVVGKNIVAEIIYPDCLNYEGRKVLVYRDLNLRYLMAKTALDPHFCNTENHTHPFARFEPTEPGWAAAVWCAESLN